MQRIFMDGRKKTKKLPLNLKAERQAGKYDYRRNADYGFTSREVILFLLLNIDLFFAVTLIGFFLIIRLAVIAIPLHLILGNKYRIA